MNPFTRPNRALLPERVSVPGVDQGEVEALQERFRHYSRNRRGYLLGMIRSGKPIYGGTVTGAEKAQRRARGKRQRQARKIHRGR